MEWVIFYAGGSQYSNLDGLPHESPVNGAVAVAMVHPAVGFEVRDGYCFIFKGGRWWSCDMFGMIDQFSHFSHEIQAFRLGRWTTDQEYSEIMQKARETNLPIKSGLLPTERK